MNSALITGATSGIGLALANELAKRGCRRLALLARRGDLLESIRDALAARGCEVLTYCCDVQDHAAMSQAVDDAWSAWGSIDVAVANAGIGYPTFARRFVFEDAAAIMRTNVEGMFALFAAVVPRMVERGSGRFVGVASLAGFRGVPGASTYSASKAAMISFLEASRIELHGTGVGVTIVSPGFVDTPIVQKNRFRLPFLMKPDEAAAIIADGIESGRRHVAFPAPMVLLAQLARFVPAAVYDFVSLPVARKKRDMSKARR